MSKMKRNKVEKGCKQNTNSSSLLLFPLWFFFLVMFLFCCCVTQSQFLFMFLSYSYLYSREILRRKTIQILFWLQKEFIKPEESGKCFGFFFFSACLKSLFAGRFYHHQHHQRAKMKEKSWECAKIFPFISHWNIYKEVVLRLFFKFCFIFKTCWHRFTYSCKREMRKHI
jgi:hypothetical protein